MTKAQKENQARFKKVQAEAKKLKAKNPRLAHTEAVKRAWAIILPKSSKKKVASKKIGNYEEEEELDYNSIPDLQAEIRRLNRWAYQYNSKGQDATIKRLEKRVEYLQKAKSNKKVGVVKQKSLKEKQLELFSKALKMMPNSPNQLKIRKELEKVNKKLKIAKKKPATKKAAVKKQTGKTKIAIDKKLQAKPVGKRLSKSGKIYYEARANRSDKGRLLGVKKKPAVSKHKDTQSHNVSIRVMSGIKKYAIDKFFAHQEYKKQLDLIAKFEKSTEFLKKELLNTNNKEFKTYIKKQIAYNKKMLTEYKTHARELKKLI